MTTPLFAIHVFQKTRQTVYDAVADLTDTQLLAVPTGFANNIAWNIGHIITIQQAIVYGLSGLEQAISAEIYRPLYWANTSPADWGEPPNSAELIQMLLDHPQQLAADYAAGKFANTHYKERTSGSGIYVNNIEDAISYNNYHEGLHLGAILALKEFVKCEV